MVLLRHLLGDALRRLRLRQGRTLREVSASARVSLGYLSEVERGQKEASSELLAAICSALGTPLSQVLREVSDNFALAELQSEPVFADVIEPAIEVATTGHNGHGRRQPPGRAGWPGTGQQAWGRSGPRQPDPYWPGACGTEGRHERWSRRSGFRSGREGRTADHRHGARLTLGSPPNGQAWPPTSRAGRLARAPAREAAPTPGEPAWSLRVSP